jgi:hypothetical protein
MQSVLQKMFNKEALEFCTEHELWKIVAALEYQKKRGQNKMNDEF